MRPSRACTPCPFLPALLQTLDYTRAVFRDMENRSAQEIRQLLAVRLRRQEALRSRESLEPLRLIAVTHESSLRQLVGSADIMREQLDELLQRSTDPNVTLHVLPFTAKPVFSMTCMYALFEYKDVGESDIVHIETHAGFFTVEDEGQVKKYRTYHEALLRASLTEEESRELHPPYSRRAALAKVSKSCDARQASRSILPLNSHHRPSPAGRVTTSS